MNVRLIRPAEKDTIRRVQQAAQNGAVTVVQDIGIERFIEIRRKAHTIDKSLANTGRNKS
jgi:hypothetical protein